MLALTGPRIRKAAATYAKRLEIDATMERKTFAVLRSVLAGNALTRSEIKAQLRKARVDAASPARCAMLLMYAELAGLVTSGPRKDKQFTYALLDERAPATRAWDRDESLGELATRYFQSRRPATIQDFVWWSGLLTADARRAVEIARVKIDERPKTAAKPPLPIAHLLPIYDEYPLSYRDRSAAAPKVRPKGSAETIFVHLVLINGLIEGYWTRDLSDPSGVINVKPFRTLNRREWAAIEREGERHAAFLGAPVRINHGV